MVGFGEYAGGLQRLWAALAGGDVEHARELASKGRQLEGGPPGPLRMLSAFLSEPPAGYRDAARAAAGSVAFAGRLEHDEVAGLVPATDALVFPSTFPESFGMVAAEAAAAGVLPVSAAHSGAAEVSRVLAAALPAEVRELVSFPLDDGAVRGIAERLNAWLRLDEATRERARRALAQTASERWSWEGVASGILAASGGPARRADACPRIEWRRRMTRATLVRLLAAILVLTVVTAVPMTQIAWDGTQASAEADDIDTLLNVMIVLSCFVFAIVMVMLGYCIWKYRAKPGDESDGEPIHGNTKLEVTWTVIPTVIVLFGAIYSWIILGDIESKASNQLRLNVTAQQFKWTFNYPQPNGKVVSSNVLVVPEGRQLDVHLTALDVLHSFWVPEWRIKRDAVPAGLGGNDVDNTVQVTPDRIGTYNVVCTEYCGNGHATMRALVRVVPEDEFNRWLGRQEQVEPQPGTPSGSSTGTAPEEAAEAAEGT